MSVLLSFSKADFFLLPCPFKYLFGFDCPGCGFQRSVLALFSGDLLESLQLYPPTIPFLLSFIAGVSVWTLKLNQNAVWLKVMYFFTGFVMVASYLYKIIFHQLH